jgi:hypothetical protein
MIAPTEVHRLRFAKNKLLGMSVEQLAKDEGIEERYIRQSIEKVEAYRALNTLEELEASQVEVVLFNRDLEKLAIRGSLTAVTEVRDDKGKILYKLPDHETRLKGVEVLAKITDNLIGAKARAVNSGSTTNVNILNAGNSGGVGIATFEDRLREVKKKRAQLEEQNLPAIEVGAQELEEFSPPDWEGSTIEQGSAQG